MKFSYALGMLLAFIFLAGCCITPPPGTGGTGTTGQDDGFIDQGQDGGTGGDTGGDVVVVDNSGSGGMSDPSKCRNLPIDQQLDCLDESLGN